MITLLENVQHQMTAAGQALIAESKSGNVDVTGFTLLDAPEVTLNDDGSMTLRIAVPEAEKPARKVTKADSAPDQAVTVIKGKIRDSKGHENDVSVIVDYTPDEEPSAERTEKYSTYSSRCSPKVKPRRLKQRPNTRRRRNGIKPIPLTILWHEPSEMRWTG